MAFRYGKLRSRFVLSLMQLKKYTNSKSTFINVPIMPRVNIFNQIHKGLRAALYDAAISLQQTDFTIEAEAEEVFSKVKEVVMLFDEHAHRADKFILSAISQFEPSVVDAFEQEL